MTFSELTARTDIFADTYDEGVAIDVDFKYGDQCWDLAALFALKVVSCPSLPTGARKEALECYTVFADPLPKFFTRHPMGSTEPRKGDLIVWGINHIAIFLSRTPNGFISLDQNWPLGTKTQRTNHTWHNVIGWLRPITKDLEMITTLYQLQSLFIHYRNRLPNEGEVKAYLGKVSFEQFLPVLDSGDEHGRLIQARDTGIVALRDNWTGQIRNLQTRLETLQRTADELAKRPTQATLDQLQTQIRSTTLQVGETMKTVEPPQTVQSPAPRKVSLLTKLLATFIKTKV